MREDLSLPGKMDSFSFEMDRNLMSVNRLSEEYSERVDHFLDFCEKYAKILKLVLCPCLKCGNMERVDINRIKEHLFRNEIDKSYKGLGLPREKE
ncbi:hypothetical protein F8388_020206 [Cannabis sativa]|uniref:Transposase-associated domain-containing protein n=1 Tax=Cannabis sativa TaxID=3483 RepID=A0A7J6FVG6_CANSA|nr:hypothetical protein F8388_020206 [Cannabis sativa]